MKNMDFTINSKFIGDRLEPIKYGFVMGRFQPFHFGHQHIINEIILGGRVPIVLIGDDNGKDKNKNPLSNEQRKLLIEQVFPNLCEIRFVKDNPDWTQWFNDIDSTLLSISERENIALYFHNKEVDRYDSFECNGKKYKNEFYTKIFENAGYEMIQVEFVERSDIRMDVDARNIRDNFEDFRHLIDGRNYWTLKAWGW